MSRLTYPPAAEPKDAALGAALEGEYATSRPAVLAAADVKSLYEGVHGNDY